jgi:carbon storage regulator
MLVLTRERDESIIVTVPPSAEPVDIVVTIVDIRGDKVRLGINAPPEVPVHRQEVYESIQRENMRQAGLDPEKEPLPPGKFPNRRETRPGRGEPAESH